METKVAPSVIREIKDVKNNTLSHTSEPSDLWKALGASLSSLADLSKISGIENLQKWGALGVSPKSSATLSAMEALALFPDSLYSKSTSNKEVENVLESSKNLLNAQNSYEENDKKGENY